jgi:hypothetical protein
MISTDIKNRVAWFRDLWGYILEEMDGDKELARPVYKRILFEEKY